MIKLIAAPLRRILRFPLVQLALVVALILWLQAAAENSVLGSIFDVLDTLVEATVTLCAQIFSVKSFTRSWLTFGFMVAYVYLACLLVLSLLRIVARAIADSAARSNWLGLRNSIARERGIAAYRAWVPLERIRPAHIPQNQWEQTYAWPANNRPPYPPLAYRVLRGVFSYAAAGLIVAALLQLFTPFPALTWLGELARGFGRLI